MRFNPAEQVLAERLDKFPDSISNSKGWFKVKPIANFFKVNAIISGVAAVFLISNWGVGKGFHDPINYHLLGKIVHAAARVENFEVNRFDWCFKNPPNDFAKILNVTIRAPRIGVIYKQIATQINFSGELTDGKIEPHARREPKGSSKAQYGSVIINFIL